jgi:hypothetical protein
MDAMWRSFALITIVLIVGVCSWRRLSNVDRGPRDHQNQESSQAPPDTKVYFWVDGMPAPPIHFLALVLMG